MKRYDVIDGHTGDKSYAAGDTRIADPSSVTHLVTLGVLREEDDQSDLDGLEVAASEEDDITALHERIKALTDERDEAEQLLAVATQENDARRAEVTTLRELVETLEQERTEAVNLDTENEALRQQVETLTADLAAARPAEDGQSELTVKAELPLANKMETLPANKTARPGKN